MTEAISIGALKRAFSDKETILAFFVLIAIIALAVFGFATAQFLVGTILSLFGGLALVLINARNRSRKDVREIRDEIIPAIRQDIIKIVNEEFEKLRSSIKVAETGIHPGNIDFSFVPDAMRGSAGIFVVQNGRLVYVSDYVTDISGYTTGEIYAMGEQFLEVLIHEDDIEMVREQMLLKQSGTMTGIVPQYQVRVKTKYGRIKWILLKSGTNDWKGSQADVGIFMDITQHVKGIDTYRDHSREKHLFDTTESLIIVLNKEGLVKFANKTAIEVIGCDEEDLVGHNWFELCIPADQRESTRLIFYELVSGRNGRFTYVEHKMCTTCGDEIWIGCLNSLLRAKNNRITGVYITCRILTGDAEKTAKATYLAKQLLEERRELPPALIVQHGDVEITSVPLDSESSKAQ
jgi:PAS domain S-box-containing protein